MRFWHASPEPAQNRSSLVSVTPLYMRQHIGLPSPQETTLCSTMRTSERIASRHERPADVPPCPLCWVAFSSRKCDPNGECAHYNSRETRYDRRGLPDLCNDKTDWENELNRPVVSKNGGCYQMWYTGQVRGKSQVGYATSEDGKSWKRASDNPVLSAEKPWEKVAVMCPHVIYHMWCSGGEQHEPIGIARSKDGITDWNRRSANPIIRPSEDHWELRRLQALCDLRRKEVAPVVQRSQGRRRADRTNPPRRGRSGVLKSDLLPPFAAKGDRMGRVIRFDENCVSLRTARDRHAAL